MALFVCSCENKTYAGFFNNKDCKDCGTKIHNSKGVIVGGYQWKAQRNKELEAKVKYLEKKIISVNPDCEYCGGDEVIVDEDNDAPQITVTPCPLCLPECWHNETGY